MLHKSESDLIQILSFKYLCIHTYVANTHIIQHLMMLNYLVMEVEVQFLRASYIRVINYVYIYTVIKASLKLRAFRARRKVTQRVVRYIISII